MFETILWAVNAVLWGGMGALAIYKGESPNIAIIAMMCSCILMKLSTMGK